jgi:genome maintenance exonuclease 1
VLVKKFEYLALSRSTQNGRREYLTPDGQRVASVTTILDATKPQEARQALEAWRQNVGQERAKQITTEAANRGTRMHKYLEDYIKGEPLKESVSNPYAQESLNMAKTVIAAGFGHISEVWGNEVPLYFPELYAGTTDCVGVHNGHPSIIDFKQSNKPKRREWIDDYFLQLTAYALAHNEVHGTDIKRGVVMVCVKPQPGQQPDYQEFVLEPEDFGMWTERWCDRVSEYYRLR